MFEFSLFRLKSDILIYSVNLSINQGADSWCKWQVDDATGTKSYVPPANPLEPAVVEAITPVFTDLADPGLLSHISLGATQNANEGLHSLVWSVIPKEQHQSPSAVRLGIDLGIMIFNCGRKATLEVCIQFSSQNCFIY